ncbi:MAG: hypothetical protein AW07_02968 [Candidatus Accumulibacter sp. SK-11]|nr:MAG: hypothetical protein AW07_02968 [Candidatus Accumulibacter sp. SK-11]
MSSQMRCNWSEKLKRACGSDHSQLPTRASRCARSRLSRPCRTAACARPARRP